ncbi:hypothetical protein WJX82_011572 [Trebouxia sp. C0006]
MTESHKLYECTRCHDRVLIPISPDDAETSPPSSPCQVPSGRHICKNTKYRLAPNVLIHTNYQEIKIQENAKALAVGNVPRSICVLLQDDLADMCQTGDDIEQRVSKTGGQVRAEVHMLLVGDPGTGKSQFMQYAAKLSPRAVMSSGRGSSSAGLTVTAIKDGGQWALEAGALVLADGGVCCIDEFDGIKEADKTSIHEVMEQQTLSVAKAGLVTSLTTRTTVFGAMNPRGNPRHSIAEQTSLSGPLLSRFDILLPVLDAKSSDTDELVSEHILTNHQMHRFADVQDWDIDTTRQYLLWVKATFHPELSVEAEEVLTGYYKLQRTAIDRTSARTTVENYNSAGN